MRTGTSAWLISTGVFLRYDILAPQPSAPSAWGPPPAPPPTGPIDAMTERPPRVVVLTFIRLIPLPGEAGMRSGKARQKAPITAVWARLLIRLRIPTAAGMTAFITEPSGRMARAGRTKPALSIAVGSRQ